LVNIRKTKRPSRLKGIEGKTIEVEEEGDLLGYGPVYYHQQVTANVLSLFNMARSFHSIEYNNKVCDVFLVTRDDGTIMEFVPSSEGLYYYDFNISVMRHQQQRNMHNTMMVATVDELRKNYKTREMKQMDEARRLYVIMGRPSKADFLKMIKRGKLLDNPVRMEDFYNAEKVFGKDLGVVKGKTVRVRPNRVVVDTETAALEKLNIILAVDVMNFTGLSFLVTVSRSIGFITASLLRDRKKRTIVETLKQVMSVYKGKGHTVLTMNFTEQNQPVHTILGDNEFEDIQEDMLELGVEVNVTAKEEHVPEIEQQHRVIKERARAVIQTLPYGSMPKKMRVALIQNVKFWLNNIPKAGQDYSPKDLVCGEQILNYRTVCRLPFGAYAQVHDDQSITNTMTSRTTGAISLGVSGNAQGTYKFMSLRTGDLRTGDIVVRRSWTELPMPSEVIDRIMELTTNETDNENYQYELDELDDDDEEEKKRDDLDGFDLDKEVLDNNIPDVVNQEQVEQVPTFVMDDHNQAETESITENDFYQPNENQDDNNRKMGEEENRTQVDEIIEYNAEEDQGQTHSHNLRPNRERDYSYRFTFLSVREGLKKFGQKGREAILDE
jgi:hypothetical protein